MQPQFLVTALAASPARKWLMLMLDTDGELTPISTSTNWPTAQGTIVESYIREGRDSDEGKTYHPEVSY